LYDFFSKLHTNARPVAAMLVFIAGKASKRPGSGAGGACWEQGRGRSRTPWIGKQLSAPGPKRKAGGRLRGVPDDIQNVSRSNKLLVLAVSFDIASEAAFIAALPGRCSASA
jgi:hypothetical protein